MKKTIFFAGTLLVCLLTAWRSPAQAPVAPPAPAAQLLNSSELDQILGPIALYPDPLIAQILPAATFPAEIVLADRYVTSGGDPNQIGQEPWDPSVQALARYPAVLKYLDDNLGWTTELGTAFINQQQDVMDSIQRLRASAQNLGNLQSTPQQQVVDDSGDIEILPADPQVIYVPVYSPDQIYYQGGFGLSFGVGFTIGGWLNHDFDWHHHNLIVWGRNNPRPADWWHERPEQRDISMNQHAAVWRPADHRTASPVNRGDRGWNNQPAVHPVTPIVNHPEIHSAPTHEIIQQHDVQPHNNPVVGSPRPESAPVVNHPEPVPVERAEPASRPVSNSAFIGIQSSEQTRTFSNRGQQSMQPSVHSAPAPQPHAAPPMNFGGGGGGSHSQPKH